VIGVRRPGFRHILILGAAMAALAVAGCGRKGPLDPPPSASAVPQDQQQSQQQGQQASGLPSFSASQPPEPASQQTVLGGRAGIDSSGAAIAPVGEKRRIPLDVLID
jgi:predicted small lipoprotein YifL